MHTGRREFENSRKIYNLGEKGSGYKPRGSVVQDFYKLRDEYLAKGMLFEDPDFKTDNTALFGSAEPKFIAVWKRPKDICRDPRLFVERTKFNIKNGDFGNDWLLAAVANLTLTEHLFHKVIPSDQSFTHKYAGIFHFRFWKYSKWIDVVVDDRLPILKHGEPAFLHSSQKNEFWSSLLEKAYAKLLGTYEDLVTGSVSEGMVDFTGGIMEVYYFSTPPHDLYQILYTAWERSSLISVATKAEKNAAVNVSPEGLFSGHAYNITKVMEVHTSGTSTRLVRICNPWNNQVEWRGPWSEKSSEWISIPEEKKKRMNLVCEKDGEFWMSYEDLIKHFYILEICHFSPESLGTGDNKNLTSWEVSVFEGKWVRGVSAGGCRNFLETFVNNPQYTIEIRDPDDRKQKSENKCTLLVALMQKPRGFSEKVTNLTIGFIVFKVKDFDKLQKPFDKKFFEQNTSVGHTPSFMNLKEVLCRFSVPPGMYCIIPSTFNPNLEAEFILRIFTVEKHIMKENDGVKSKGIRGRSSTKMIEVFNNEDNEMLKFDLCQGKMQMKTFTAFKCDHSKMLNPLCLWEHNTRICCYINNRRINSFDPSKFYDTGQILNPKLQELEDKIDKRILVWFHNFCDEYGELDYMQLRNLLNTAMRNEKVCSESFSKSICHSMISMVNTTSFRTINLEEFRRLWDSIKHWMIVYKTFVKEKGSNLSAFELRNALYFAGFTTNNYILDTLVQNYSNENRELPFEDYLMCAIKLQIIVNEITERGPEDSANLSFSSEEWIKKMLSI